MAATMDELLDVMKGIARDVKSIRKRLWEPNSFAEGLEYGRKREALAERKRAKAEQGS